MKKNSIVGLLCLLVVMCAQASYAATDKVAVLITGWGIPVGYNFDYAWTTSDYPRIGDKTETENQACKIGHVGEFPYQSHINMIPWAITYKTPGNEAMYDYHGIYKKEGNKYISPAVNLDPALKKPEYMPRDSG